MYCGRHPDRLSDSIARPRSALCRPAVDDTVPVLSNHSGGIQSSGARTRLDATEVHVPRRAY